MPKATSKVIKNVYLLFNYICFLNLMRNSFLQIDIKCDFKLNQFKSLVKIPCLQQRTHYSKYSLYNPSADK